MKEAIYSALRPVRGRQQTAFAAAVRVRPG